MASRRGERREIVTRGTRNAFADLGFPDAAKRQAKLRLTYALNQVVEDRKLSQADAAKTLGVTQPKMSALGNYKAGWLLCRAVDEPIDGARSGCGDRDSPKTALTEDRSDQRRRSETELQWRRNQSPFLDDLGHLKLRGDERSLGSVRAVTFVGRLRPLVTMFTTAARGDVTGESRDG